MLLTRDLTAKLADVGFSRLLREGGTHHSLSHSVTPGGWPARWGTPLLSRSQLTPKMYCQFHSLYALLCCGRAPSAPRSLPPLLTSTVQPPAPASRQRSQVRVGRHIKGRRAHVAARRSGRARRDVRLHVRRWRAARNLDLIPPMPDACPALACACARAMLGLAAPPLEQQACAVHTASMRDRMRSRTIPRPASPTGRCGCRLSVT